MKLLLNGQVVAAGNLSRQVVEGIALALLCSGKGLTVLERVMKDDYAANKALRNVRRHCAKLGLLDDALKELERAQRFYNRYSHPSRSALAEMISLTGEVSFFGAAFDPEKLPGYQAEVAGRVALANVFVSVIGAARMNLAKW